MLGLRTFVYVKDVKFEWSIHLLRWPLLAVVHRLFEALEDIIYKMRPMSRRWAA